MSNNSRLIESVGIGMSKYDVAKLSTFPRKKRRQVLVTSFAPLDFDFEFEVVLSTVYVYDL